MGETELAAYYEIQSKKIDSKYSTGGMEVWKRDLESHQKIWEDLPK